MKSVTIKDKDGFSVYQTRNLTGGQFHHGAVFNGAIYLDITKEIRNDDGDVIAHEPTTHHYTFGSVGSELSGGFYLKAGDELPKMIHLKAEPQDVVAKVPALDITVSIVA